MKVALVGGTGFIGSYLIDALLRDGLHPVVLVRPGSESKLRHADHCGQVVGDLADEEAISQLVKDADAVIYNVGILREFPARGITFNELQYRAVKRVVDAARQARVSRFLLMSANGVGPSGTAYQRSKHAAEEYLRKSGMNFSIFRPSVVFGDPRGRMEFATQLCRDIVLPPFPAPLFFAGFDPRLAGQFALSPVHVEDVARAFVNQLVSPGEQNRVFHLGGPQALTWKEIIQTIARSVDRNKLALPVPVHGVKLVARMLDRFEQFPVTRDQLTMLLQGNTCGADDLRNMGIKPKPFGQDELAYLKNVTSTSSAHVSASGSRCYGNTSR